MFEFIVTELELATTFAMAEKFAVSATTAERNRILARQAYGSAILFLPRAQMDMEMAEYLKQKVTRLQVLLSELG